MFIGRLLDLYACIYGQKAVYKRSVKRRQNNCLTCIYANFYRFFLVYIANLLYLCTRNSFNLINAY